MKLTRLLQRRRSRQNEPALEVRWSADAIPVHPAVSPVFLAVFFILAGVCFAVSGLVLKPRQLPIWANIVEHVGIAFLVALILGGTYEYFLHEYRERMFRRLFDEHREKMFEALKVHLLLTPEQVFDLLGEIAIQTDETPTLYRPAREHEYTFANSIGYFNTLMEVRRKDIINVLQKWIDPKTHPNLKFLASDFIGMYQLQELATELRSHATRELDQLNENNRGWVLNYVWAVSRCEQPRYHWLEQLVSHSDDESIHDWVLFVPRQMQDKELGQMLERFLEIRGTAISDANLAKTARALAALQRAGVHDGKETLRRFVNLFSRPQVLPAVKNTWRDLGVPVEFSELTVDH